MDVAAALCLPHTELQSTLHCLDTTSLLSAHLLLKTVAFLSSGGYCSCSPGEALGLLWGGHEPRVYAAVCFWLCRGRGGNQLSRACVSVCAAAGPLLCIYRRVTCPALRTLLTQTLQVQTVCMLLKMIVCAFVAMSFHSSCFVGAAL